MELHEHMGWVVEGDGIEPVMVPAGLYSLPPMVTVRHATSLWYARPAPASPSAAPQGGQGKGTALPPPHRPLTECVVPSKPPIHPREAHPHTGLINWALFKPPPPVPPCASQVRQQKRFICTRYFQNRGEEPMVCKIWLGKRR